MADVNVENYFSSAVDELKGVSGLYSAGSDAFTASIRDLQHSSAILGRTIDAMNKSMAFASREMQSVFKRFGTLEAQKDKFTLEFYEQQKDLEKTVKEFKEAAAIAKAAAEESGEAADKEIADILDRRAKEAELFKEKSKSITAEQAFAMSKRKELTDYSKKLVFSAIDGIVDYFQKAMTEAWSKLNQAYEQNYSTITSYNSYSKAQYNQLIDELQDFIKNNNLQNVVNIADYQDEISKILSGGLNGDLAKIVAEYSILSKEGGISTDFSDQSFLKMIKNMNDAGQDVEGFLKDMMTQSKAVINEVGDSFGFANGEINTMVASLYQLSSVTNMTDEALKSSTASMTALNGVLGSTEIDTNKLYSNITSYATGGLAGASAKSMLDFSGKNQRQMQELIESQGVGAAIEATMRGIYDRYQKNGLSGEFIKLAGEALGEDFTPEQLASLFKKYGTYDEFEAAYSGALNAANHANADKYMSDLQEYQTNTEKLQNETVNKLTDLNQYAHKNLATEYTLNSLVQLVGSLKLSNALNVISNLGNMIKGTSFGKTLGFGSSGDYSNLNGSDAFVAGAFDAASLTKAQKTGGKIGAATGVAAGVTTSAISGINLYQNIAENKSLSQDEKYLKIQEEVKHGGFDWDQVLASGGIGAGAGMAIGSIVGGTAGSIVPLAGTAAGAGIGGAIGGGIGFIVGAGTDMAIQQAIKHDTKQFIKSELGKLTESFSDFASTLNENQTHLDNYARLQTEIQELQEKSNGLSEEEVALLQNKIRLKEREAQLEFDSLGSIEDMSLKTKNISEAIKKNELTINAINQAQAAINDKGITSDTNVTNMDFSSYLSDDLVRNMINAGIIKDAGSMDKTRAGIIQIVAGIGTGAKGSYYGDNIETNLFGNNLSGGVSSSSYGALLESNRNYLNEAQNQLSSIASGNSLYNDNTDFEMIQKQVANWVDGYIITAVSTGQTPSAEGFGSYIGSLENVFPGISSDRISQYKSWLTKNAKGGEYSHYYKTGLSYVPYDNFPAILHEGERVQTAQEVALEAANKNFGNSDFVNKMINATNIQTDTLSEILSKIYKLLLSTVSNNNSIGTTNILYSLPSAEA